MNVILFKLINTILNILIWVTLWNLLSRLVSFLELYFDSPILSNVFIVVVALVTIQLLNNGLMYRYSLYN